MTSYTIERLDADAAANSVDALAAVLVDCVEGGASVNFMWPFPHERAVLFWEGVAAKSGPRRSGPPRRARYAGHLRHRAPEHGRARKPAAPRRCHEDARPPPRPPPGDWRSALAPRRSRSRFCRPYHAGAGHRDRQRRRASLPQRRLEHLRRYPELRPLPGRPALCDDGLLESSSPDREGGCTGAALTAGLHASPGSRPGLVDGRRRSFVLTFFLSDRWTTMGQKSRIAPLPGGGPNGVSRQPERSGVPRHRARVP